MKYTPLMASLLLIPLTCFYLPAKSQSAPVSLRISFPEAVRAGKLDPNIRAKPELYARVSFAGKSYRTPVIKEGHTIYPGNRWTVRDVVPFSHNLNVGVQVWDQDKRRDDLGLNAGFNINPVNCQYTFSIDGFSPKAILTGRKLGNACIIDRELSGRKAATRVVIEATY